MLAQQQSRRLAHGSHIQRIVRPARPPHQQRRAHRRRLQQIAITPPASIKARVKIGRNGLGVQHRNAIGQMRVHAAHPSRERARGVAVKMHHLRRGVHACVGAPSGGDGDGFARNLRERVFQRGLNGGDASGLLLEAEKRAAVVG